MPKMTPTVEQPLPMVPDKAMPSSSATLIKMGPFSCPGARVSPATLKPAGVGLTVVRWCLRGVSPLRDRPGVVPLPAGLVVGSVFRSTQHTPHG